MNEQGKSRIDYAEEDNLLDSRKKENMIYAAQNEQLQGQFYYCLEFAKAITKRLAP
jgi:hypothetical protein